MAERKVAYRVDETCEEKRPLRRHRGRWENNIKMDSNEIVWYGVDWTGVAQNRNKSRVF
jgi:hypothetical protein